MSAALLVEDPGLSTTLQDLGRFGYQALGVPVSGALDPYSLGLANRLVGNAEGEAALEIRLIGPTLRVEAHSVCVALAGTGGTLEILAPERRSVPGWRSVTLERGTVFRAGTCRESSTAYIAVGGGFDAPEVLGSRATYARGGIGGFEGRRLAPGNRLALHRAAAAARVDVQVATPLPLTPPDRIRVVLGPQDDYFDEAALALFLSGSFEITTNADRMGLRLSGRRIAHAKGFNIVSDGIATGAIQVPGDGQPILLLADRQTVGGYPKIATVISADLPAVGRMRPGQAIQFEAVSVEAAEHARREAAASWERQLASIKPVIIDPRTLWSEKLLDKNLISGVTDAFSGRDSSET